jgi:DNA-repair protein XRCC3
MSTQYCKNSQHDNQHDDQQHLGTVPAKAFNPYAKAARASQHTSQITRLPCLTALDLYQKKTQRRVSLGCAHIDFAMNGGLRAEGITEFSGESSSGKTQVVLQLLLQVQLPEEHNGLGGGGFFLSTEGDVPMRRLRQLASSMSKRYPSLKDVNSMMENIFVENVHSIENLYKALDERLPHLLRQQNVKLVVIDSIAALFRGEVTGCVEDLTQRSALLLHMGATMKRLSHRYQLPFVVVNQVNDVFSNSNSSTTAFASSSSRQVAPAMGLSWSHCVNTRIMLSRIAGPNEWSHHQLDPQDSPQDQNTHQNREQSQPPNHSSNALRQMELIFSPCDPSCRAEYVITADGLFGVQSACNSESSLAAY